MPGITSVRVLIATVALASVVSLAAQAPRPGTPQEQPARDTPARDAALPSAATPAPSRITGRVVAADSGRPVGRARVFISGSALADPRAVLSDNEGRFELADLPEGRYSLTAGKAGFITVAFGQRRPLQAGTPLQVAAGQQITGVEFRLPRGSVIAGRIVDENGDPLPGAAVTVLRYVYTQGGARQLAPAGGAQTDDLGAYRVWGLNPGQYLVSAALPQRGPFGRGNGPVGRPMPGRGAAAAPTASPEHEGYAPTYYPGVPSVDEARAITVALGAEASAIDFGVLLVRTAHLGGIVRNPDGTPVTAGLISLATEGTGRLGGMGPGTPSARIQWDGAFTFPAVPPGRYTLRARSDDSTQPQFAEQPLIVTGDDVDDLVVVLAESATLGGTVQVEAMQGASLDLTQVRVSAPMADGVEVGPASTARVGRDGRFTIEGVRPGAHLVRVAGNLRGWTLKSVQVDGRDVTDTPLEIRSGQSLGGLRLLFTDRLTEINGTVADEGGTPSTDLTVLAFAVDEDLWRPLSRHIATARPDQNGRFQLRGLPAGDYFVALVDPEEQGQWFEPAFLSSQRPRASRVSLVDGDVKTQDFTWPGR